MTTGEASPARQARDEPTPNPAIAAIVVTYNSAATICRCLTALRGSDAPLSVTVVDNASSDGTAALVASEFPDVHLTRSPTNLGFAAACNVGIEANESSAAFFLLVNPDAYVEPTCVGELLGALASRPAAAVACPLILDERTGRIWYAGALLDIDHGIFWHVHVGEDPAVAHLEVEETGRPTGCVMLVRSSAVELAGLMDPSYFLYFEDVEWAVRLHAQGLTTVVVPSAVARHEVSSSTGGDTSKVFEYYYLRNRLRLVHETAHLSKRELVAANLRGSAATVRRTRAERGWHASASVARACALAYFDFARGRFGRRATL